MIKKILYPIVGVIFILAIMQFSYDPFVFFTGKIPCKEGCSTEFISILKYWFWGIILMTIALSYCYAIQKIKKIILFFYFSLFFLTHIFLMWYASTYGYGLNLSY
ncbi:hypothetical protein FPL18_03295 [Acinetobacter gyllenbergii]|nr:hypothetical protein FPL18_03295 [Acinetobacter gyllenbergii]